MHGVARRTAVHQFDQAGDIEMSCKLVDLFIRYRQEAPDCLLLGAWV